MCLVAEGLIAIWKQKTQSSQDQEENMSAVISWTTGTQSFIQTRILFPRFSVILLGF